MKPSVETYLHFAMHDKTLRFSPTELVVSYRKVVREMIEAQEYQISCHQDGTYGQPPNQQKIDEITEDLKLLSSYLETKEDEKA